MVNICEETGLTLPDCECDDCTSLMLDLIRQAIDRLNENLDTEILSQITAIANQFANYYDKEQTLSLIESSGGMHFEEVNSLPDEPQENVIYLLPLEDGSGNCNYGKWFFYNGRWESMTCDGETSAINLEFITDCGSEFLTFVDSGTFPLFEDVCPDGADDPNVTFNGWYCALYPEVLYDEEDAIPQAFFEDAPCTALEANTTKTNYMVFVNISGDSEEGSTKTLGDVFPNYTDLFIVTTPLGEDEEYWWSYSYGGNVSVDPGTLYAEGDVIPSEFYNYDGGSAQDPHTSPHFIGVVRGLRTVGIRIDGEVDSMQMAIFADGVQIDTVEVQADTPYTYTIYDGAMFDAQPLEWVNDAVASKEVTEVGGLDFVQVLYDPADTDAMPPMITGIRDDITVEVATTQEEQEAQLAEILNGVSAVDGYGMSLSITINAFDGTSTGVYDAEYTAVDGSGNTTVVIGTITVENER